MNYLPRMVAAMETEGGAQYVAEYGDVPRAVKIGGKLWPMGQYFTRRLRSALGLGENVPKNERTRAHKEKLQAVRRAEAVLVLSEEGKAHLKYVDALSVVNTRATDGPLARRVIHQRRSL